VGRSEAAPVKGATNGICFSLQMGIVTTPVGVPTLPIMAMTPS
jgi:hypothetical protein